MIELKKYNKNSKYPIKNFKINLHKCLNFPDLLCINSLNKNNLRLLS